MMRHEQAEFQYFVEAANLLKLREFTKFDFSYISVLIITGLLILMIILFFVSFWLLFLYFFSASNLCNYVQFHANANFGCSTSQVILVSSYYSININIKINTIPIVLLIRLLLAYLLFGSFVGSVQRFAQLCFEIAQELHKSA